MRTKSVRCLSHAIAVVIVAAAGLASNAHAAFVAYICDDMLCTGGGDTIVTDQGVGDNFPGSALVGQINAGALSVGGFTIVTNVANLAGAPATPKLDLTFLATTSDNQSHTIYLYTSATGLTGQGTFAFSLGGSQPAGTGNTVTGRAFGGTSNTNLNLGNVLASFNSGASPFALTASGAFASLVNPYSLTIGVEITRTTAGSSGGGLELSIAPAAVNVPEPAAVALLGIGLAGFATTRRRRRS